MLGNVQASLTLLSLNRSLQSSIFNELELHLQTGFEDAHFIVLKAAAVCHFRVRGTYTPDHILIGIEVVAECPVVQITTIDACRMVRQ